MLDGIKAFFISLFEKSKNTILAVLAVLTGILFLVLKIKEKKVNELEAQVSLAKTQKEADVIEADIKNKMDQAAKNNLEITEYENALNALAAKRKSLSLSAPGSEKEEEKFWNN